MYSHLSGKWQWVNRVVIRIMAVCAVIISVSVFQLTPVFAQPAPAASGLDIFTKNQQQIGENARLPTAGETNSSLPVIVGRGIAVILSLVGVGFFALSLYAGYLWMDARGNDDKISRSKDILKSAVIGLIVIAASYAVTSFVLNAVTLQDEFVPEFAPATEGEKGDFPTPPSDEAPA